MTVGFPFAQGSSIPFSGGGGTGSLLARQVLTTASSAYAPSQGATRLRVRMVGGGGGGGGASGGTGFAAAGGGGSGGWGEFEVLVSGGIVGGGVSVGAGGAAGASGAFGGNGAATQVTINATTYVVNGGMGGEGGINTLTVRSAQGGAAGTVALQPGNISSGGSPGLNGQVFSSGAQAYAGNGGSNPFGAGGRGFSGGGGGAANVGGDALGYGGGGGGAFAAAANLLGGAGVPGLIVIEEYS